MSVLAATIARTSLASAILLMLLLAGCGGGDRELRSRVTVKLPSVETAGPARAESAQMAALPAKEAAYRTQSADAFAQANAQGSSRYSSLEPSSCQLLGGTEQERAFARRRCAGTAGYALERSESDPLHDLAIVSPKGARSQLDLATLVPGGSLGKIAEWRGHEPGQPRALIMRVSTDDKDALGPGTSNLVVVKLDGAPCIVAVVPRGPGQNSKARAVADRKLLNCSKG
jgi:hypothetical protein